MNTLARIAYLAATDPAFRQALQADPEAAVASHGLSLDDEAVERGAGSVERHSLDAPRSTLYVLLLRPTWGRHTLAARLRAARGQALAASPPAGVQRISRPSWRRLRSPP